MCVCMCECMNANVHACMYVVDLFLSLHYIYGLLMKQNFKMKFFFCLDSFFLSLMGYRSNGKMAHKRK